MNNNPVFIVDDDADDQEFIKESWKEFEFDNPLVFFGSGEQVIKELKLHNVPFSHSV